MTKFMMFLTPKQYTEFRSWAVETIPHSYFALIGTPYPSHINEPMHVLDLYVFEDTDAALVQLAWHDEVEII
jgi:hypothetical protein